MNLFLPPFPEPGLTQDYVDAVNAIFTTIANHTHEFPDGNRIESDSINWTTLNLEGNILNLGNVSFYDSNISLPNNDAIFVLKGDLYFNKSGVGQIQITKGPYVNATVIISGFSGNFQDYGVSLFFDSVINDYTFTSNLGSVGIRVNTMNASNIITSVLNITTFSITNAPNLPNNSGYAYFNSDGIFEYSDLTAIKLDHTTLANTLIFDNKVTNSQPPIGLPAYPPFFNLAGLGNGSQFIIYTSQPGVAPDIITKYSYSDIWFPLATPDNKQMFFGQFFQSGGLTPDPLITESVRVMTSTGNPIFTNVNLRFVYSLNRNTDTLWDTTRINHYQFHVLQTGITQLTILDGFDYLQGWNDFLIENSLTDGSGKIEKIVVASASFLDVPQNQFVDLYYFFNFLFDFGTRTI